MCVPSARAEPFRLHRAVSPEWLLGHLDAARERLARLDDREEPVDVAVLPREQVRVLV